MSESGRVARMVEREFLILSTSFEPPKVGEHFCVYEAPKPGLLCWLGFHRSICHNVICGQRFDTCNDCMRRV